MIELNGRTYLTSREIRQRYGLGYRILYSWRKRGLIRGALRMGPRLVLYPQDEVEAQIRPAS